MTIEGIATLKVESATEENVDGKVELGNWRFLVSFPDDPEKKVLISKEEALEKCPRVVAEFLPAELAEFLYKEESPSEKGMNHIGM